MEHQFLEYDEDKCRACIVAQGDTFCIFLNKDALIEYRDSLFGLATIHRIGEEIGLWNVWTDDCPACPGTPIGYFEITLVSDEVRAGEWTRQNGQIRRQIEYDRLDLYLNRDEVGQAYQAALQCMETTPVLLPGGIRLHLVPDDRLYLFREDRFPRDE